MLQARKLRPSDYDLIRSTLQALIIKTEIRGRKAIHRRLDLASSLSHLFSIDTAFIVGDAYLVAYDVGIPWYSTEIVVSEKLVMSLVRNADFVGVPEFFEQVRKEAGASWIQVGTALALHDRALASLYEASGYRVEGLILTKDHHGISI